MSDERRCSITVDPQCVDDIRWLEEQVGFAKDAFLRKRGWVISCESPGSYWLWSKTIERDVYERGNLIGKKSEEYRGVSRDMALQMEATLDCWQCECDGDDEGATESPTCPVHGDKAGDR